MRQSGDFNGLVGLYERTPATAGGESRNSWVRIGTGDYPAEVRKQSDQVFASGETRYMATVLFVTLRRLEHRKLTSGLRLTWDGLDYEVIEVLPDKYRKGFIRLRCRAVTPEGVGVC